MTINHLPAKVVEDDHKLEDAAVRSQEKLAHLRWHWTMDESNEEKVTFGQYAKDVGRSRPIIAAMAQGYARWVGEGGSGSATTHSLGDCLELAKISGEKAEATEAVAEASGKTISTVARHHREDVKAVVRDARENAERRGTTVEEEIPKAAISRAKTRQIDATIRQEKKSKHGLLFTQMEGHLLAAKRRLTEALDLAEDAAFDDDEQELLRNTIANLKSLLDLIDLRLGGTADVDWDAELAKLGGRA